MYADPDADDFWIGEGHRAAGRGRSGRIRSVFSPAKDDRLTPRMQEKLKLGTQQPDWTKRPEYNWYSDIKDNEAQSPPDSMKGSAVEPRRRQRRDIQ